MCKTKTNERKRPLQSFIQCDENFSSLVCLSFLFANQQLSVILSDAIFFLCYRVVLSKFPYFFQIRNVFLQTIAGFAEQFYCKMIFHFYLCAKYFTTVSFSQCETSFRFNLMSKNELWMLGLVDFCCLRKKKLLENIISDCEHFFRRASISLARKIWNIFATVCSFFAHRSTQFIAICTKLYWKQLTKPNDSLHGECNRQMG